MIIVLPTCPKDEHLALLNLDLARRLDKSVPNRCLIPIELGYDAGKVIESAKNYFGTVDTFQFPKWVGKPEWPRPGNWCWQSTVRHIQDRYKEPWFWWEPDCVPLEPGWIGVLEKAYVEGKKPFMGYWMPARDDWKTPYMVGIGVYPPNVGAYGGECLMSEAIAWDLVLGKYIERFCHKINELIDHHIAPVSFPDKAATENIKESAVLFHKCKDGSLPLLMLDRENALKFILKGAASFLGLHRIELKESPITVVITNWKRPDKVTQAFQSCLDAGVRNIVVSASAVDSTLASVHKSFKISKSDVVIDAIDEDRGCNEMWLRGVRLAKTPWVHLLHDDDKLLPSFGKLEINQDVGFCHWNGSKHWSQADISRYPNLTGQIYDTFPGKPSGVYPTDALWRFLLNPQGLTLSPVSGLFRKEHLMETLEECEQVFQSARYHYRPTLMVGNDLMIWLRAVEKYKTFYFYREPKISYGHWEGSCSFEDGGKNGHAKLKGIYTAVKDYFYRGPDLPKDPPMLIHLHSIYSGAGRREADAMEAWWKQYDQGRWTSRPVPDRLLPRLFNDGKRQIPYLKDLIEQAWKMDGDICVLSNLDVLPVPSLSRHVVNAVMKHGACYSYRRDIPALKPMDELQIRIDTNVYAGMDLFAFTRAWWKDHGQDLPDLLYATETWDYCLKVLMDSTGGKPFYYLIYHVAHQPECQRNKDSLSQKYNRKLASEFLHMFKINPYWETGIPIENPR